MPAARRLFLPLAALLTLPLLASCREQPQAQQAAPPLPASPVEAPADPAPQSAAADQVEAAPPATPDPAPVPETPALPTYTTRGEVVSLPGIDGNSLRLHHERIPTFANKDGNVGKDSQGRPGMKPMVMPFGKAASVSYDGLQIGDKVEVTFEVHWSAERPDQRIVITKIAKLPAETALDFEGQPSINDPKPATPPKEPK